MFPCNLLQYFVEHLFLEHLHAMASISSIERDSIVITQDSFKDYTLHVKLEIEHAQSARKEVRQAGVVWLKNGFSIRHMFCATFVPLSGDKIFKEYLPSSSFLVNLENGGCNVIKKGLVYSSFLMKIHIHMEKLPNSYFYNNCFKPNFLDGCFSELLFLAADRTINKIDQRKLKSGHRQYALEMTLGNYVFTRNYFVEYKPRKSHGLIMCH